MRTVVVTHKVGDFDTWMTGHQDRVEVFGPAITGFRTFGREAGGREAQGDRRSGHLSERRLVHPTGKYTYRE